MSNSVKCYAALEAKGPLVPHSIVRRNIGEHDIDIDILFTGICHTDVHFVNEDWRKCDFPMVPGHEIVGVVKTVGSGVTKFSIGEKVGVGVLVDSCRSCHECKIGLENYCETGKVGTYASKYIYDHCVEKGNITYGGYSSRIVVDENYVLRIPPNLDLAAAAPLLCAGITTYSPLMHHNLRPNHKLAVAGLGGLGHMAVKFGVAFGAHVTVMSRGLSKKESALQLGAHDYLDVTDAEAMKNAAKSFDMIVDTIACDHDMALYMNTIKLDGVHILVGLPTSLDIRPFNLVNPRRTLAGSNVGGIKETQEMLDFCGRKNITCDIELVKAQDINEAYKRLVAADVRYRFVLDIKSL